ncbi:MAG: DNA repair protein RecO [Gammaproteobacteria bacterium]|nr:DNA repair protein RecO [Gammaproteobacteria bacterium]
MEFTQAFVLHQRPYRETSLLVDVFTADYGRLSLVARSMRQNKRRHSNPLQLFQPVWLNWFGRGDLLTLSKIETTNAPYWLQGHATLCGLYINELLVRLLTQQQPEPLVFDAYQKALEGLQQAEQPEQVLRLFEKRLLEALGYGLDLTTDNQGDPVEAHLHYSYQPELGLQPCLINDTKRIISGASLLQLQQENLNDPVSLSETKQLMRLIINYYLDGKPLKSRQLFAEMQRYAGTKNS